MLKKMLRPLLKPIMVAYYSLGSSKSCNLCGWTGWKFRQIPRPEKPAPVDLCPRCGSQARHRLVHYLLCGKIGDNHRTLHCAPEHFVVTWLKGISSTYLSIDLNPKLAMQQEDLTNLSMKDYSYTLVWCSHVLEHIPNDRKAMQEIYRVLEPGGRAVVQVPIYGQETYEDFSVTNANERIKHFKQHDHVRIYGMDIIVRLKSVGFNVNVLDITNIEKSDIERFCLDWPESREVFVCTRPSS